MPFKRVKQLIDYGFAVALFLVLDADRDDMREFARASRLLLEEHQRKALLKDRGRP